jgi:hypothetical protein
MRGFSLVLLSVLLSAVYVHGAPLQEAVTFSRTAEIAQLVGSRLNGLKKNGDSICDILEPALPDFCHCTESSDAGKLACKTSVLDVPLAMTIDVEPCAQPSAFIDFSVSVDGVPWDDKISAGEDGNIPIPGLSFSIPGIPISAGAVLAYSLDGNAAAFKVKLGLDACADVPIIGNECASSVDSSDFPISLLDDTFDFSDMCNGPSPPGPSPPSPSPPSPPSPGGGHYEDPNAGSCSQGEDNVEITGVDGSFCSPECSNQDPCPTDVPDGATAEPQCVLKMQNGKENCALICNPNADDQQCPKHASCKSIQSTGVCTYDN